MIEGRSCDVHWMICGVCGGGGGGGVSSPLPKRYKAKTVVCRQEVS